MGFIIISGFIMYFYYGIKNSSLETESEDGPVDSNNAGNIELKITEHSGTSQSHHYANPDRSIYEGQQLDAFGQPVFGNTSFGGTSTHGSTTAQTHPTNTKTNPLFVAQDSLPSWDDWVNWIPSWLITNVNAKFMKINYNVRELKYGIIQSGI